MPELPEVERIRSSLEPILLGREVRNVRLIRRDIVATPDDPPGGFARSRRATPVSVESVPKRALLNHARITAIRRHGKQLALLADTRHVINIHLGMTGQLLWMPPRQRSATPDHVHILWRLDDGSRLLFRDARRFGGVWTCTDERDLLTRRWGALGPDALSITTDQLTPRLARTARPIKAALLDQRVLAGVGNIYADEALFRARILPHRHAESLTRTETNRLAEGIRSVLSEAIEAGGTTLRDYRDPNGAAGGFQLMHNVYGRAGSPCHLCSTPLSSATLAQRTTVWCQVCQQ